MYYNVRRFIGSPNFVVASATAAGVVGVVVSLFVSNPFTRVMPPLMLLGTAVGYLLRNEELPRYSRVRDPRPILICYCVVMSGAIAAFAANGFERTLGVHGLLLALYLLVALSIVVLDSTRTNLGLVVLTGVIHRGLIYYASAVQIGMDALFHNRAADAIATSGSMAPLATSKYWYAPVYHLLTASGVTVLGVDVRQAAFLLVTVTTTLLLVAVVYLFLEPVWGETVALVGGLLVVIADRTIFNAIHTTPTSIGVVLFGFLLLYAERYLDTGRTRFLGLFGLFLAGLVATHQLSLFVALVVVGTYVCANVFWDANVTRRGLTVLSVLVASFVLQTAVTDYSGPEGDSSSFLVVVGSVMIEHLGTVLEGTSGRPASKLPPGEYVAIAGADAMSVFHVAGSALLLALALAGSIYWMDRNEGETNRVVLGLGAGTTVACVFVYLLPLLGVSTFLPDRWQIFLYVILALLAAPALVTILTATQRRTRSITVALVVFTLVIAPYTALMIGNGAGAVDGPVFDDSPGADRLATTPEEERTYEFTVAHAGDEATIVADHVAYQMLNRHYEQPATSYSTSYAERGTTVSGEELVVYRGYAQTEHGSYYVTHEDRQYHVYGPLPGPNEEDTIVYTDGQDRIVWRSGS
ncbi:hypothetical protein ACFO5R_08420 [Halosolutus amylolyticus]|uniref:Dolichyl-phosphate-mannose-protein mannosyltransferase n=1 Tax=Halosolutus amylolyticus TaxID=2932267 RepID=A0ABD5PMW7_9EURY|nr:hypothetical protein [Halosolutus amylolyticus]